jgi:hypothetical protein
MFMKRLFGLSALLMTLSAAVFAQSGTTTVNNTITIQGNVYYFKPATTPSSLLPEVTNDSSWIGDGEWWGKDAAKAWASIIDWVILHCFRKDDFSRRSNAIYYINRLSAKKSKDNNKRGYIDIYYWEVPNGKKMEEGRPVYEQWFVDF